MILDRCISGFWKFLPSRRLVGRFFMENSGSIRTLIYDFPPQTTQTLRTCCFFFKCEIGNKFLWYVVVSAAVIQSFGFSQNFSLCSFFFMAFLFFFFLFLSFFLHFTPTRICFYVGKATPWSRSDLIQMDWTQLSVCMSGTCLLKNFNVCSVPESPHVCGRCHSPLCRSQRTQVHFGFVSIHERQRCVIQAFPSVMGLLTDERRRRPAIWTGRGVWGGTGGRVRGCLVTNEWIRGLGNYFSFCFCNKLIVLFRFNLRYQPRGEF